MICGAHVEAHYEPQQLAAYRGNPCIEALPAIHNPEEAARLLAREIPYDPRDRSLPGELRQHLAAQIVGFVEPLPQHLDLDARLSRLIRLGYLRRNPLSPAFQRALDHRIAGLTLASEGGGARGARPTAEAAKQEATPASCMSSWRPLSRDSSAWTSAAGLTVLGISGIGKTTAIEASLSLYPQVLVHARYGGRTLSFHQVVWLKLDCPFDGSTRGLCVNFFDAFDDLLGTTYTQHYVRSRDSAEMLIPRVARVAWQHTLGVLVIDEVQHLSAAGSGGERKMLNFFVQLVNRIGLPVVLIGTYRAQPVLSGEFRQVRRGSGQGDFVWDRMTDDKVFRHFCEALWAYQYVREPSPLSPEVLTALFDESQGVTDIVVKLYVLAQQRAIARDLERVDERLIRSVAADSLRLARPILQALKTNDRRVLANLDDVVPWPAESPVSDISMGPTGGTRRKAMPTGAAAAPQGSTSGEPLVTRPQPSNAQQPRGDSSPPHMGASVGARRTHRKEAHRNTRGSVGAEVTLFGIAAARPRGESGYGALDAHGFIRRIADECVLSGAATIAQTRAKTSKRAAN